VDGWTGSSRPSVLLGAREPPEIDVQGAHFVRPQPTVNGNLTHDQPINGWTSITMTCNLNIWGSDPSADAVDHWLDDALRAVPVPDGFLARVIRLADAPPEQADDRDHDGPLAHTRGLADSARRHEASRRRIWSG